MPDPDDHHARQLPPRITQYTYKPYLSPVLDISITVRIMLALLVVLLDTLGEVCRMCRHPVGQRRDTVGRVDCLLPEGRVSHWSREEGVTRFDGHTCKPSAMLQSRCVCEREAELTFGFWNKEVGEDESGGATAGVEEETTPDYTSVTVPASRICMRDLPPMADARI
jgi:hypothetical protein